MRRARKRTPDDDKEDAPEGEALVADPVEREGVEPESAKDLIQDAVQLEYIAEDDPDHRDREDVREEKDRAVDAPAAHPVEEQHRDEERDDGEDGDGEQEERTVLDRLPEGRVLEHEIVVQEAGPHPTRAADQPPAEVEHADE
jgi:hypothetical protein